jgi:hypothetical protein
MAKGTRCACIDFRPKTSCSKSVAFLNNNLINRKSIDFAVISLSASLSTVSVLVVIALRLFVTRVRHNSFDVFLLWPRIKIVLFLVVQIHYKKGLRSLIDYRSLFNYSFLSDFSKNAFFFSPSLAFSFCTFTFQMVRFLCNVKSDARIKSLLTDFWNSFCNPHFND